jgi:hypothetical protein
MKRENAGKRWPKLTMLVAGLTSFGIISNVIWERKSRLLYQPHSTAVTAVTVPSPLAALDSTVSITTQPSQLTTGNALELDTTTSIIITSSWIPIHPSTIMIDRVVESCFKHLKGVSPNVPIYIGVDMLPDKKKTPEKLNQLAEYIANLETLYANRSNIIIRPQEVHRHLSGMVNNTLALVKTKYLYVLQHDFPFARDIEHSTLVKSMEQHPEHLRCVRFNWKKTIVDQPCGEATAADHVINGLDLYSAHSWSDK